MSSADGGFYSGLTRVRGLRVRENRNGAGNAATIAAECEADAVAERYRVRPNDTPLSSALERFDPHRAVQGRIETMRKTIIDPATALSEPRTEHRTSLAGHNLSIRSKHDAAVRIVEL